MPKAALIYLLWFLINYWVKLNSFLLCIYNHVLCNVRNTSIFRSMQIILCIKSGSWWLIETKNHISVVMNSCGKWLITACFMYTNFPWKYFDHFGHYEPLWSDIKILVSTNTVSFRFLNDKFSVRTIENFQKQFFEQHIASVPYCTNNILTQCLQK